MAQKDELALSKQMSTPIHEKATVQEIRARFDQDVDRFSQLDTGQSATMDAPLAMQLITEAAVACSSPIRRVLDIGCGAGNNTLKLRAILGTDFDVDLLDLSQPMLARATERVAAVNAGEIRPLAGDFRDVDLAANQYHVVLAAAVFHHLREDADWERAFAKVYRILAPGGSVWITDLVWHETQAVQRILWQRYSEYLVTLRDETYRDHVFDYIDREDSPRPVTYQLELLRQVGFRHVELLHKNACFAALGAVK